MPKTAQKVFTSSGFFYVICALLVVAITIVNISFSKRPTPSVAAAAYSIEDEISFWKEFALLHPTYRDAFIQLAKLYLEEGKVEEARQAVEQALKIDPLSEEAKLLLGSF